MQAGRQYEHCISVGFSYNEKKSQKILTAYKTETPEAASRNCND